MNLLHRALSGYRTRVAGIDPGQTTGVCIFEGPTLIMQGQLPTGLMPEAAVKVMSFVDGWHPEIVVMENYRVYSWKADTHSWMELHTPKLIGAIQYALYLKNVRLVQQMAGEGKAFVTDKKLQEWDLYKKGEKHARDAMRHAIHYMLFKEANLAQGLTWDNKPIGGSDGSSSEDSF